MSTQQQGERVIHVLARRSQTSPWLPAVLLEARYYVPEEVSMSNTSSFSAPQQRYDTIGFENSLHTTGNSANNGYNHTNNVGGGGESFTSSSSSSGDVVLPEGTQLLCFVVWKDEERRLGSWVDTTNVDIEADGIGGQINEPYISHTATTKIPQSKRQAAPSVIAFLEERLGRDMKSANGIRYFRYAGHMFQPWFYAPLAHLYPQFSPDSKFVRDAYVCPFTLKPFVSRDQLIHETQQYVASAANQGGRLSPPGREIYRDDRKGISLLEVDGAVHRTFCRNLFLICKSFLDNKLAGHDVDLYMFYILCVHGSKFAPNYVAGASQEPLLFAGFYSWEKEVDDYNLACIMTMPCFQGHGFGNFLISVSYELAYRRRTIGTPERPLSDLGAAAYERYWWTQIARFLHRRVEKMWTKGNTKEQAIDLDGGTRTGDDTTQDTGTQNSSTSANAVVTLQITVNEIAKRIRLEDADVLDTLLKKGLIHRTEKKDLKVVVPVQLVKDMEEKYRNSKTALLDSSKLMSS